MGWAERPTLSLWLCWMISKDRHADAGTLRDAAGDKADITMEKDKGSSRRPKSLIHTCNHRTLLRSASAITPGTAGPALL